MSAPDWMPLYIGDYLADTGHLSAAEHGAYLLLIMHYWRNGSIPTAIEQQARVVRMTPADWAVMRETIASFFDADWKHGRIEHELTRARDKMDKRSRAGKAGASARYNRTAENGQSDAGAMANAQQAHANEVANACHIPIPIQLATEVNSSPSSSPLEVSQQNAKPLPDGQPVVESDPKPKQPRGTRWPDGAVVPQDWHTAASEARARYGLPPIDLALEAAKFEHWWASRSGTGSTKVDWKRTWINWTLKASSNGRHNGNGTGAHRKPSAHDNFLLGAAAAVGRVDLGDE